MCTATLRGDLGMGQSGSGTLPAPRWPLITQHIQHMLCRFSSYLIRHSGGRLKGEACREGGVQACRQCAGSRVEFWRGRAGFE
ncbi:hypothetical protein E2C01_038562 [Portunus trituberculatus]|uniref:Uncharacterized protein n=1 Tax=Portunus trituberculatus TaxID=210409 RepID=A0A5B7FCJ5_PORTR|nr:hypothetical protein [Portunus trituberculatus]